MQHFLAHLDWGWYYMAFQGVWSTFWSFAPTPQPNTWYDAWWHVAQWIALNPGRSMAVSANQRNGK